jgi:putative ABC transport system permease protein
MLPLILALRELRGGLRDFRIFIGCLVIGVAVIAAVGTLSGRIELGVQQQAKTLLGGDVELILANTTATAQQMNVFHAYGTTSVSVSLSAMATWGDTAVLVELEGVDAAYPLLGGVQLASRQTLAQALAGGKIVAEQSLFDRLGVTPHTSITLGIAPFTLSDVIQKEPDRIASAFSLGPHVIAATSALEKAGLLQPGGLVRYHYHILLHNPKSLDAFLRTLSQRFPHAPWILKTYKDSNQTLTALVDRLQLFMTLAGLSSLLIGGVGILNAIESYIAKQYQTIATLKALGASRALVLRVYLIIVCIVSAVGVTLSACLGELLAVALMPYLAQFFPVAMHGAVDFKPLLLAMLFGMLTVLTFSVAALGRAVEVKPTLLFRGIETHAVRLPLATLLANLLLAAALIATLVLSASDIPIALGFIGSALLCFALFAGVTRLIQVVAARMRVVRPTLRLAVANLHRPGNHVFSIMLSIGIGLTVLVALLETEGNIRREIRETIPANAPSLFLIDIQPAQKDAFLALLRADPAVSNIVAQPMVRGRIARLNHIPVDQAPISQDAKWATQSDRGVSYADTMPAGTRLAKGAWWPPGYHGAPLLSLDATLAKGMHLGVGDSITINILGQDIEARITSLRQVNYANFHINFAMILSPGVIEQFPATFIATAKVNSEAEENALTRTLSKRFPNISTIRIRDSLAQLQGIVENIASAIRVTALAALLSGLLVLASALAATLDKRAYDTVVMKVLGATRHDILTIFLLEWLLLALVTAVLACILGSLGAWLILQRFEWVAFRLLPLPMAEVVLLALASITVIGLGIQSRVFTLKPVTILRNE